jgi:cytoskeletal protein CcmA (bactofilin family)
MFNSKAKLSNSDLSGSATTIIGAGTTISGNIESNGDIRIDGTLKGNLNSGAKILIGANGVVEGNLYASEANVQGRVFGEIKVNNLLHLRGNANVEGNIYAGKLQMEPTITFNGQCHMGANIVELNSDIHAAVNQ